MSIDPNCNELLTSDLSCCITLKARFRGTRFDPLYHLQTSAFIYGRKGWVVRLATKKLTGCQLSSARPERNLVRLRTRFNCND
jgi:hypothetical protein